MLCSRMTGFGAIEKTARCSHLLWDTLHFGVTTRLEAAGWRCFADSRLSLRVRLRRQAGARPDQPFAAKAESPADSTDHFANSCSRKSLKLSAAGESDRVRGKKIDRWRSTVGETSGREIRPNDSSNPSARLGCAVTPKPLCTMPSAVVMNDTSWAGSSVSEGECLNRSACSRWVKSVAELSLAKIEELVGSWKPGMSLQDVTLLPVVPDAPRIFCVGLNYEEHRVEAKREKTGQPTIFLRVATSQVGHAQPIVLPRESTSLDYEARSRSSSGGADGASTKRRHGRTSPATRRTTMDRSVTGRRTPRSGRRARTSPRQAALARGW